MLPLPGQSAREYGTDLSLAFDGPIPAEYLAIRDRMHAAERAARDAKVAADRAARLEQHNLVTEAIVARCERIILGQAGAA